MDTVTLRASRSGPDSPDDKPSSMWAELSGGRRERRLVLAAAAVFLVFHLPFLMRDPGGIDAANFVMGVRHFDIANHQPHPPGYPVFIALGKLSNAVLSVFRPASGSEALALAFWSALAGALTAFPLLVFFQNLELSSRRTTAALMVTMTCPLFWSMGARALSDVPGLAAALVSQALLLAAFRRQGSSPRDDAASSTTARLTSRQLIVASALVAGLGVGLRSQTVWLTLPLMALVVTRAGRRGDVRTVFLAAAAFAIAVLAWAIPLLAASGGVSGYLDALAKQGVEDLAGVDLLVTNPTFDRLVSGLRLTLAFPWADRRLAVAVLALGTLGAAALVKGSRTALMLLAVALAPYAVFHLLFQEFTVTRYALPIVPAVAYLAVRGIDAIWPRATVVAAAGLSIAGLLIAMPSVASAARDGSPAYQALSAVRDRLARELAPRPVLANHYGVALALRAAALPVTALPSLPRREWLEVVDYWSKGGAAPVWFLTEPRRTDLALVDPASQRLVGAYGWTFEHRQLVSGVRPDKVEWHEIDRPGWFVGEGWSLTREWHAATVSQRRGPGYAPIVAYLRRRPDGAMMLIGGRNFGLLGDREARVELTLDGRPLESWIVPPENRPFFVLRALPAGALVGDGPFARLEVRARPTDGSDRPVSVSVDQFDLQPLDAPLVGFDVGWFESEYDAATGAVWRWMGPRATLRARTGGSDRTLHVRAAVPLEYLPQAPTIVVMAGARKLARVTPASDLAFSVRVPANALDDAGGILSIETDQTFVPATALGGCTCDQRSLGLRVFDLQLR